MFLIVGLGNPGESYKHTRHNAGFLAIDFLAQMGSFSPFVEKSKFRSTIASKTFANENILLIKPQTYMNLSGESVRLLVDYFKISTKNILLLHDDKDFALGELRLAKGSSSAGHRGVLSIFEHLNTRDITRIRIGIGTPPENVATDTYVLGQFSFEEQEILKTTFPKIQLLVQEFLQNELSF